MSLRQSGRIVTLRLTRAEHQQLLLVALRDGDTLSAVIREALYQAYDVGAFPPPSSPAPRPAGNTAR